MFRRHHPAAAEFHRKSCNRSEGAPVIPAPIAQAPPGPFKRYPGVPSVSLPAPRSQTTPLGEALRARLSCRHFSGEAMALAQLSDLLGGGFGLRDADSDTPERPLPSGGNRYPLELYVLARNVDGLEAGTHHYAVASHALEQLRGPTPWSTVRELFLGQAWLEHASMIVVVTGVLARTLERYGERGFRFVHFEAGHCVQNLTLLAAAQGLGTLSLGGFYDAQLAAFLGLDMEIELPLYGLALGVPEPLSRGALRDVEGMP